MNLEEIRRVVDAVIAEQPDRRNVECMLTTDGKTGHCVVGVVIERAFPEKFKVWAAMVKEGMDRDILQPTYVLGNGLAWDDWSSAPLPDVHEELTEDANKFLAALQRAADHVNEDGTHRPWAEALKAVEL